MGLQALVLRCLVFTSLILSSQSGIVKKVLQQQKRVLSGKSTRNSTHPNDENPVIFSHVYNIDVPVSSLCSADSDTTKGSELEPKNEALGPETTDHMLDGKSQIVFNHRINIPKQACDCTDGLSELKDLLSRLEVLEGEVSTLKGQCAGDIACCGEHVTGELRTKPYCGDRGNFSTETCSCICEKGWSGPNCTLAICPDDCNDQGRCVDGKCECFEGFSGEDCNTDVCPVDCGEHGRCIKGVCVCAEDFSGEDCSKTACPNNCFGHGYCVDGKCECLEPWTGFDCSEISCPNDCSDHGHCINGTCLCDAGFRGEDCGQQVCPKDCMGQGFCVDGRCVCNAGYTGEDCATLTCPNNCNNRGQCLNGMCVCDRGYQGDDCSTLSCPNNCYNRGRCLNGICECNAGFRGDDCAEISCSNNCNNRGQCVNGQCVCQEGFAGEDCSVKACPFDCYGRGRCVEGKCVCFPAFTGEDCSELSCPNNCQNRGQCVAGQCVCDEGFTGEDCSQRRCPNDCLGRGDCVEGRCVCIDSYAGEDCAVSTCPAKCTNHGRCINGICVCDEGYMGVDCGERQCPNNCRGMGQCVDGQCVCEEGYIGDDCSEVSPPKDLSITEITPSAVNLSWTNEMLVKEYLVTYVPTAPGGLQMDFRVPGDHAATTITELEPGIEYLINVFAILNNKKSIPVSARVATNLPQPEGLKFKSIKDTSVEVFWDQLDFPFDGWELTFHNTKEDNGKIVNTLAPSQIRFEQSGLRPGQEYEVSVGVIKNNTKGLPMSKTIVTRLDAPGEVKVLDVTDTSALISWSSPLAEVDKIRMSYGPSTDMSAWQSVDVLPENMQHSLEGLEPDTEYQVSLSSKRGDMTSEPVHESFTTGLDAPHDLQTIGQSHDRITVEWRNSRAPVDGYRIKYGPVSGVTHLEDTIPGRTGETTHITIVGLKPGTEYGVGVTAFKNDRESQPGTINIVTDLDAPRDLKVRESAGTTMVLSWKKPRAKFSKYRLRLISPDGQSEEIEVPSTATTFTHQNLVPGMSYNITLVAERGQIKSDPATLTASTDKKKPLIGSVSVSDVSWDSFNVSWGIEEGAIFENFTIEVTSSEDDVEGQNISVSGDTHSLDLSGLSPNTSYRIALFGVFQGSFLDPHITKATTVSAPVLGNLYVYNITSESFFTFWNGTDGNFEGFILEVIDSTCLGKPTEYNLSNERMSFDITGLKPSNDYIVYLSGVFKGKRTPTISAFASTAEEPDLSGLVVSNVTSNSVSLSWRKGEKMYDNFIVEVRESALPSQAMGHTLPIRARSTVLNGLKGDTQYQIKLYATAGNRNSPPLTAVVTTETSPKLGSVVVSDIQPNNFTLSWSVLAGNFDHFFMLVRDRDQLFDIVERNTTGTSRNITIPGLVESTVYDITFYGISHDRRTPSIFLHTTTAPLPKVENISVSDITPYGFRVSWEAQSVEDFSHFNVMVSDSGQLLEPQGFLVPGNQTSLEILGLITAIGYKISVTGVSQSGLQSRSVTTMAMTEAEPEIEHLFVSDVTPKSLRLAWTADDIFDQFVIKVRDTKKYSHLQEFVVLGDKRTKVLTELTGGTEYEIEIYGVTLEHRSQPITAVARTGLGAPQEIHFSEVTDTSASVHWNVPHDKIDAFRVTYVPLHGGIPAKVTEVDGHQSHTRLTNLTPGERYQVSLTVMKGLEESEPVSGILTTVLDMPQSLSAVNVTDTKALLLWQPSLAAVDEYVITYNSDTAEPEMEHVTGNTAEYEMSNLEPATQYTVSLHATKNGQKSDPTTISFITDVDAPRDLTVSNVQTDSAVLTWKSPHAPIEGYVLTFETPDAPVREEMLDPFVTSHKLTGLRGATEYNVKLRAIAETDSSQQQSKKASTSFSTDQVREYPKDCSQTLLSGKTTSGLYTVYPGGDGQLPVQVYCDMSTDAGGWLVIMRRLNGIVDFYRNWKNYTEGFGDENSEFWLGLNNLHKITASGHYELRVDLRDGEESVYALYDRFYVADPRSRYKVQIGAYSGTAGDSMTYHHNRPFSTYDKDNDIAVTNCALSYKGAFWYKNCHRVNLMGQYGDNSHSKGINWFHWKGHEHSIPFAEMKIRPVSFRHMEGRWKER